MSAASSPNPSNLLLLAVIGIGAYWFMSRRAVARPVYAQQQPSRGAQNAQMAGALLGAGVGALGRLFGGSGGQPNPITWDGLTNTMPAGWTNPNLADGIAVNPVNSSPWEWWTQNGTAGD